MVGIRTTGGSGGSQQVNMTAGRRNVYTDADGLVEIKDVPAGKYGLTIKHRGHETHRQDLLVQPDARLDLGTLKLGSGGAIRGTVAFPDDAPMRIAEVELTQVGGKRTETTIANQGSFRFDGLSTGKYKLRARPIGNPNVTFGPAVDVDVKTGATAKADLTRPKK